MRISMIADLETGIAPLPQCLGARIALAVNVELPFVDEQYHRDLFGFERTDQAGGDSLKSLEVAAVAHYRTVVYSDGYAPGFIGRGSHAVHRCHRCGQHLPPGDSHRNKTITGHWDLLLNRH